MNNKFIEYLVTEKLKDITYYLKEIETEKPKLRSNQIEQYPYIDDFFEFLFEANVSQEEIFTAIRKERASYSLVNILFGYETQNDQNRQKKIEQFKPLLENNINFYKQLMKVALSEHQYIREQFQQYNEDIFNYIVEVGIEKQLFQYFNKEELQTQVPQYKKILIERGIFNSEYHVEETIKILNDTNESKITNHFSMYSHDIHQLIEDLDMNNYNELTDKIIKILNIDENNKYNEVNKAINKFIYYLINVEKTEFLPLIKNKFVKQSLLVNSKYDNKALSSLIKHQGLLEELLSHAEDWEKNEIYRGDRYSSGIIVSHFIEISRDTIYIDEQLLTTVLENIDKYTSENEDNNKSLIISHILFNQFDKIKDKKFIDKIFDQYSKNIVKALSTYGDNFQYFKYQERIVKFKDSTKWLDKNTWDKINTKLKISEKDKLYKFSQQYKEKNKNHNDYIIRKYIEHLSNYINLTEDVSVLNIINVDNKNPDWKNMLLDSTVDKKNYVDENIIVYLLRKASTEKVKVDIIRWVIEESIDSFYELKFGNKDILTYYQKLEVKNSNVFKQVVNIILENEQFYEKLLKNNKPKLKLINTIESEDIQKKLNYYHLSNKLNSQAKVEPIPVKLKNKI